MQHYALAGMVGDRPVLLESDVAHAVRVMRVRVGEQFVAIWDGRRRLCRVTALAPFASVCTQELLPSNEPPLFVTAILAVTKPHALELAVQKCVEAGAGRIVLLTAHRSPVGNANVSRLQRIAKEAAEQAHRDFVPVVTGPVAIGALLAEPLLPGFLLDVAAHNVLGQSGALAGTSASLAVGPEGGWQEAEIAAFAKAGFATRLLGKTVLRAETAAAVGTYLLCWGAPSGLTTL